MKLIAVFFLFSLAFSAITEEEGVLVLTDENFEEAIAKHENLLVEFYAPWCGHCKSLAPHYVKAAAELKALNPPQYIAKVDATENNDLAKRFNIRGFPTLKFFKNGKPMDYESGRTTADIVAYVKKKSGPIALTFTDATALLAAVNDVDVAFVSTFATTSDNHELWLTVVGGFDEATSIYVHDAALLAALGAEADHFYIFKTAESKLVYDGDMEAAALKKWMMLNELPLIVPFSQKFSRKLFAPDHEVSAQMMFFAPESEPGDAYEELEKVAKAFMGKLFVVHIPSENTRLMDYFGISADKLPRVVMAVFGGQGMKKYMYDGDYQEASITEFAQNFFDGKLTPYLKSEDVPEKQEGAVFKLVGKTFKEIARSPKKNVFVKFYAPWCGHCKSLAPIYEKLAARFADRDDIIIAEMDSTQNEAEDLDIRGFPTLKLFKADDESTVVDYEGDRTEDAMFEFINKNAVAVSAEEPEL